MLDFTVKPTDLRKDRCQARAKTARKSARVLQVVLAGLCGAALISDPKLVVAVRSTLEEATGLIGTAVQFASDDASKLDLALPVATRSLDDTTVARAETTLLRP